MRLGRASRRSRPRHERRRLHPLAVAAIVIAATIAVTYLAFNHGLPLIHRFTLRATVAKAEPDVSVNRLAVTASRNNGRRFIDASL